ncbi:hypothetical protein HY333_01005 [Candidatus Collierbacteria bacterium]|nr:hypothetical protein [Candidatus Collierbacteria bacterium]
MKYQLTQKSEVPNSGWLKKFKINTSLVLVWLAVFLLAAANLIGTNSLATQGVVLDKILQQTADLASRNHLIELQINQSANLTTLQTLAQQQGFVRINRIVNLPTPPAVAALLNLGSVNQ